MNLDTLKYADLQQLAKSVGLKANMKADKLLKALKTHFKQEDSENGNGQVSDDAQSPTRTEKETSAPHVTKRQNAKHGGKQSAKRKHSNNRGSDVQLKLQNKLALDVTKSAGNEDGRRSSKRRKVSSSKDMETPASCEEPKENQPEMKPASNNNDTATQHSDKGVSKKAAGKIPRHESLLKKKVALKPTTPNFKKLHEAHFNKMESIDSYVQRRNKQMEELKNSIKDLKQMPPVRNASLFSPDVQQTKPAPKKRRFTQVSASKTAVKEGAGVFRPSVLSTNRLNVRFSPATRDNEHKRSLVKTPARMSPLVPTPSRMSEARIRPDTINITPKLTAFVFSGTSTTPATNKKNSFDLKASLSRPLNYKPHKGKLKPFGETQETTALGKSQLNTSHQKNYKQHQVQTREERRVKHMEDRKHKKTAMLGTRRGLVMT